MICFMFPGQPLSHPPILPDDDAFREICGLVRERTTLDLSTFSWIGEGGSENVKLQVLGVAMSLYHARRLCAEGVVPRMVAEHSQGIYPGLAAVGSISEGDALEMAWRAGVRMAAMAKRGRYALGCMVGLTLEPLLSIAENTGVYLANHNTSRHFLLCGERSRMEDAEAEAFSAGAFSVKLFPCDAPLHTPLMSEAAEDLAAIFAAYRYREPQVPLVNHIDQDYLVAADLPRFLLRELESPVYWEKTVRALRAAGVTLFHEVGVGDSLKKYNRWIESELGR